MALIGKIRDNSWILIVLIAVGMGGFVLQDVMTNQGKRQAANFELAEIDGQSIDYREFQKTEEILYAGSANPDGYAQKASLWRYFMEKAIVDAETEELGIGVSTEELVDLQFGEKLSPIITARFKNQNGQVDRERLNSFREAIEANELDARIRQYWAVQEKEIIKERKQVKLQNLFSKAIYTPSWMAEEISKEASSAAEFEFVKIPFDKILDDQIEITDEAINKYLAKNKARYLNSEEKRILKYIEFTVLPTRADSLKNQVELAKLSGDFAQASNDSLFVVNNSGTYSPVYYKPEDLPEQLRESVVSMEVGAIYGPYLDQNKYTLAKLVDKRIVADSVKARHILRTIDPQDPASLESARQMIDSLKSVLESNLASFDSLAIKFSQDPGSASKGGDLGYFTQGTMVPPFNYACFFGKQNEYQVVNTRFGVHLIDVRDRKFLDQNPKYQVAYISEAIVPSQETQDSLYHAATELVTSGTKLSDLTELVAGQEGLEMKESAPLKINDYIFANYGSAPASRELIRWAFEPGVEPGDISSVIYTYTDKVNYYNSNYVVVGLDKVFPKGLQKADEARNSVEFLVGNELKGKKIMEQIKTMDLNAIAAQFELEVDTVNVTGYNNTFIAGLGNEPRVINLVFNGKINEVGGPVIGNSGVYVVKPMLIDISDQPAANTMQQKSTSETKVRNEVSFKFMEALKKKADIKDNRYTYY